ncbi:TolC family protein [Phocaeicola salanitronis]|uniref:TolC family protein n=1 Tax=Phocaeicola salanitronis TaxID=376805 RepID=UPI0023FA3EF1|nr:TolC family protein [Phocaeicola salanitronis]
MKHTSKCFLMVWVWGCMAAPLAAQQVYTLDECIESALLNNARMKNAANDLASARHERKEAFTNYFPSISATGGGFLSSTHLLGMEMGPGMSLGLMKDGLVGGVTASMPLFTGGQIVQGNKLSEVNVEKYRLLGRQAENEVKLTAEQYYWQVAMLKEKLRTLHVVEAQLVEILKDVDAAVQAGVTNRNDLLQVQLRQNDTRSTRINVENSLALSRCLLAQYIGTPGDSVDVDFAVADSLPEPPDALYRRPDKSLALTPEYNLLQAKLKASRIERKMTLGKQLPTVAIGGGFVYDNLLDRDRNYWVGFATVSVPLSGWWEGSHSLKRSKLAVSTEENNLRNGSELLVINMQNTWNAVTDAYKQVRIAIESIGQSAENLRLQTDYYHAGTCTMSDLLEAQTLFQQSRDRYVEAYAQYAVKKREYLQSTGR